MHEGSGLQLVSPGPHSHRTGTQQRPLTIIRPFQSKVKGPNKGRQAGRRTHKGAVEVAEELVHEGRQVVEQQRLHPHGVVHLLGDLLPLRPTTNSLTRASISWSWTTQLWFEGPDHGLGCVLAAKETLQCNNVAPPRPSLRCTAPSILQLWLRQGPYLCAQGMHVRSFIHRRQPISLYLSAALPPFSDCCCIAEAQMIDSAVSTRSRESTASQACNTCCHILVCTGCRAAARALRGNYHV